MILSLLMCLSMIKDHSINFEMRTCALFLLTKFFHISNLELLSII